MTGVQTCALPILITRAPTRYGFDVTLESPLAYDEVTTRRALDFDTIADAVDVSVEVRGRAPGEKPKPVFDASYAAGTPLRKALEITELVGSVRLGVKAAAGFAGTNDLTASLKGHELR